MTGREVPRSVQALIVRDLARNHRTEDAIARRHHVPRELVDALKQQHGPDPRSLIRAAAELDRPAKATVPVAAPKPVGNTDGLTVEERATARYWALTTGRTASAAGPLARALVAEWDAAGRPTAPASTPADPESVPDAIETPSEPTAPDAPTPDEAAPDITPAVLDEELVEDPEPVNLGDAIRAFDDEIVDVEILPPWEDWPALLDRADRVPAVAFELRAVINAVDMLRDALREHDHREQLVMRVRDAIRPQGLHLTADQVRLVLDAIEAA